MRGEPIKQAKASALGFLEGVQLEAGAKVGLVTFGSSTGPLHGLSRDRESLKKAIPPLDADGSTPMAEGLDAAEKLLAQAQGRLAVVLFTDGQPNNQPAALAAAERLKQNGVTVWAIGIGGADLKFLERVASSADKATYAKLEELRKAFARAAEEIYGQADVRFDKLLEAIAEDVKRSDGGE
jgi:Ca-activated chloride channel family protein